MQCSGGGVFGGVGTHSVRREGGREREGRETTLFGAGGRGEGKRQQVQSAESVGRRRHAGDRLFVSVIRRGAD